MRHTPLKDRTVLITGGAGFVGMHVARMLAAYGATLVLQDSSPKRRYFLDPMLDSGKVSFIQCDLSSGGMRTIRDFVDEIDFILHLSLKVPASKTATLDDYLNANLVPLERLLRLCPSSVQGFCLASSAQVYGSGSTQLIPETSTLAPSSRYGLMKREMELAVLKFGETSGMPVSVLRYSTIYGPGEVNSPRAIPSFIRNLLSGRSPIIYGNGLDINDYLFVRDAAMGTRLALEKISEAPGIYNLGSGRGYATRRIARIVERLVNVEMGPRFEAAREPRRNIVVDIARARRNLDFRPQTNIEDGIAAEIDFHRMEADTDRSGVLAYPDSNNSAA